jgi:hypothetical protein
MWSSGVIVYALALPTGALLVGYLLHLAANSLGHLPAGPLGTVALVSAVIGTGVVPMRLPESRWRIPRSWARFGHAAYSGLFGGILGLGVFTAIPSVGFYALLAWGVTAESWHAVAPVFGAFGLARILPLVVAMVGAKRRGEYPDEELDALEKLSKQVFLPLEVVLLAALGASLLL